MKNTINKSVLEGALYRLGKQQPFYAAFLQEINISYSTMIPTMALMYDQKTTKFKLLINYDFLLKLSPDQRAAVLYHEVLHFYHQHIFRWMKLGINIGDLKERAIANVAADMAINQYIQGLPEGCLSCEKLPLETPCSNKECAGKGVKVDDFKDKDGKPFPKYQPMELYFELIKQSPQAQKVMKNFASFDEHKWDELTEEERKKMLEEAKDLLKRTIDKTQYSYDKIPDILKELLLEIDNQIKGLDYKAILREAIKKTLSGFDRENTWNKPSKRYGNVAPGRRDGQLPQIAVYIDCSGSISHTELNEFFEVLNGFLKVGAKRCLLGLWHTQLYKVQKYKRNQTLNENELESGGTDPTCVLEHIKKVNPNLSIVLSDLFFQQLDKSAMRGHQILWVGSKSGNKDKAFLNNLPGKYTFMS